MKIRGLIENRHLKSNRRLRYEDYLKSDQWRQIRELLFKRRGRKCESCGSIENLEIHHLNYRHLGKERPEDLKILCQPCHAREDSRRKYRNLENREFASWFRARTDQDPYDATEDDWEAFWEWMDSMI